jgi:hypothetical protein
MHEKQKWFVAFVFFVDGSFGAFIIGDHLNASVRDIGHFKIYSNNGLRNSTINTTTNT